MTDAIDKRSYRRRPGLIAAAAALGVSYSHLYRVVGTGERKSPELLARYHQFQRVRDIVNKTTTP